MENNHKQYKPFDRILVREGGEWTPDIYSYYNENKNKHWCLSFGWLEEDQILPYEGNEHLVGTTDEPEEEIKLEEEEWLMVSSSDDFLPCDWQLYKFVGLDESDDYLLANKYVWRPSKWEYAIRFSDFNPNDWEETKKHILCVKNGKVVRHKE